MILFYVLLAAIAVLIFIWNKFSYWERKGVKYVRNFSPFGTISQNVLQKQSMAEILQRCYNQFPEEPYFGIFTFFQPALVIRDLEVIKQIAIKDYDTFIEHKMLSSNDPSQAFTKNLFASTGPMWKRVRPSLSPAFSSAKIRNMCSMVNQCSKQCLKSLSEHKEYLIKVNVKDDVMFRFTNDAIANCIFGLESNSFKDKHNIFLKTNERISDFGGNKIYSLFGYCFNKFMSNIFKLRIIPKDDEAFFSDVVVKTINMRKEMNLVRHDMVHLLMQVQKGALTCDTNVNNVIEGLTKINEKLSMESEEISDLDVLGHSLLFLIAGSGTAALALTFASYELASNPDIQKKLYEEIKTVGSGDYNYENIQKMKYLDMVVSETLRKWPPLPVTDRSTIRPYTLNIPGETPIHLETDSVVWIPILCIQRDEKYYPDPEKFIPERFSNENRSRFNKDCYMPFGIGPRKCIGSPLALLMIKSILLNILLQYEIVLVDETPTHLVLSKKHIFLSCNEPLMLGFKKRIE